MTKSLQSIRRLRIPRSLHIVIDSSHDGAYQLPAKNYAHDLVHIPGTSVGADAYLCWHDSIWNIHRLIGIIRNRPVCLKGPSIYLI